METFCAYWTTIHLRPSFQTAVDLSWLRAVFGASSHFSFMFSGPVACFLVFPKWIWWTFAFVLFYCQSHLLPFSSLQFAFRYLIHFISQLLRSDVPPFNKISLNKYLQPGSGCYLSSSTTLLLSWDCWKSELHHDVLVLLPGVCDSWPSGSS